AAVAELVVDLVTIGRAAIRDLRSRGLRGRLAGRLERGQTGVTRIHATDRRDPLAEHLRTIGIAFRRMAMMDIGAEQRQQERQEGQRENQLRKMLEEDRIGLWHWIAHGTTSAWQGAAQGDGRAKAAGL